MDSFRRSLWFCGTVWSSTGDLLKTSRSKRGRRACRSLANDYKMHKKIFQSLRELSIQSPADLQIQIPHCHNFIGPDSEWWSENLWSFPPTMILATCFNRKEYRLCQKDARNAYRRILSADLFRNQR